jgi:replicative DNA helicase
MTAQTTEDILDAQARLIKATQHDVKETAVSMEDAVMSFLSRMGKKVDHIKTGYSTLDRYTYIDKGDFVILAGEQSAGKTAFSISLMIRMAKQGKRCVYFSLETSTDKIFDRLVTNYATLNFQDLKQRSMSDEDTARATEAIGEIMKLPMHIVNASGRTVDWIKAEAIRLRADVIFIDYLGLINSRGKSRYEMVTNTSLALHTMAQTSGITVVCLSQLKRPDGAVKRKPTMHDLRESGQIEADADLILLLYNDKENGEYNVIVEKNKEGNTGIIDFKFDGEHQSFYEVDYDNEW